MWFDEYKFVSIERIHETTSPGSAVKKNFTKEHFTNEHFTQIIADRANRVGCGITTFDQNGKNIYFVCNYSIKNMWGQSIYKKGIPCSSCVNKKCLSNYSGLCDVLENLNVGNSHPNTCY